jgi:hypothetical protein
MSRIDPSSESKNNNIVCSQSIILDDLRETSFMNVELHSVIHLHWLRETRNDQSQIHLQETFGTDAVSQHKVQRWTYDFIDGNRS